MKGRGELQSSGPGTYKGHKGSNVCVSVLECKAVISSVLAKTWNTSSTKRLRCCFAATLSCQHVVLLLSPRGLSLWPLSSYLQLEKCVHHSRCLWDLYETNREQCGIVFHGFAGFQFWLEKVDKEIMSEKVWVDLKVSCECFSSCDFETFYVF